jgi:HPt (histidine-containing phosphotransfer) domain-containing protein
MMSWAVRVGSADAPPLAPVEQIIDVTHLARMTLGDRGLELEVLQLFKRQAAIMTARLAEAAPAAASELAHTLKGSARGVGAWRVAMAAETVEQAAVEGDKTAFGKALAELNEAAHEACAAADALINTR